MQWGDLRLSTPPCAPCVDRRVYFSCRVSAVCAVCRRVRRVCRVYFSRTGEGVKFNPQRQSLTNYIKCDTTAQHADNIVYLQHTQKILSFYHFLFVRF